MIGTAALGVLVRIFGLSSVEKFGSIAAITGGVRLSWVRDGVFVGQYSFVSPSD